MQIRFSDIRAFLDYYNYKLDCKPDGAEVWKNNAGDYISFFCDDENMTEFILNQIIKKVGKTKKEFDLIVNKK